MERNVSAMSGLENLVERMLTLLNEHYIFPDVACAMDEAIRSRLRRGEYDRLAVDGHALRTVLTEHLQEVCHDKHVRVSYSPDPLPIEEEPNGDFEGYRQQAAADNFGFYKVERLRGNVGYLDFREFHHPEVAGDVAVAAMNFLANTSGLIIDLRKNRGGTPHMVALLSSYLYGGGTDIHLNNVYQRQGADAQHFWTLPYLPGKRFGGQKPVYVLTSNFTFSAAEEFTYNLKHLKRATIIGERTGGGAHPGGRFRIDAHFAIFIPTSRSVNPVTQTNWEGTGVEPDIAVPAAEAFTVAYRDALQPLLEGPLAEEAAQALADLG
jgi:C-terminal processing protease CtpA/Prc